MDFKQLEAFVKTLELRSFSKAADALFLSQPSVSIYINALENELGKKLLTRTTKDVAPTSDGNTFYKYAKSILSLRDEAVFELTDTSNAFKGELEIHASSVPAQYMLPEYIVAFNKLYPQLTFHITMSDSLDVINRVAAQKCEFGIVGTKIDNSKCHYKQISSESIIMIVPPDSRLTSENLSTLIESENFISREEGSGTRFYAEEYLRKLHIEPKRLRVVAQFTNSQSVVQAVSQGLGFSIVSEIAARDYLKRNLVRMIAPKGVELKRSFYFVYRNDVILSPIVNVFKDFVCRPDSLNP
jgi:DNA-binding transcriptional LysR family regulator